MKKKKEKSTPAAAISEAGTVDLKSLIHEHSLFFDGLIELIPARFYLPTDDDAKPWFQGLSKVAKAAAKKQTRENLKQARRLRLDPEGPQSSTLALLEQSVEVEKQPNVEGKDEDYGEKKMEPVADGERSVTYEELRLRLRHRIELLRGNRGESSKSEKRDNHQRKRKHRRNEGEYDNVEKPEGKIEKDVNEAVKGVEFGKVKLGDDIGKKKNKKRKLSKEKELERAKMLQEARQDPEKGDVIAKKHSWTAAVSRAAGLKVHDDPKLIKQSMHKEKKRHEKNAEKWKERVESREKMKAEKQQKRAGNIAERIQQKKMRKIAKREKKLMRPGFEGRKEGFINEA